MSEEYDLECIERTIRELGIPVYEEDIIYFLVVEKCRKVGRNAKKKQ
ncbi:hypothetical protein V6M85_00035 [Sulfolobus tengchongensis]|uniref:Uncharacterized protein n=1 Tax=Sulfolobus tengchongensis TaxID=207809 RepID=A0AAX4L157_9CREN